jgi:hypothetical protein
MLARLRRNQKEKKRKEKGMINASEISKNNGINQKNIKRSNQDDITDWNKQECV